MKRLLPLAAALVLIPTAPAHAQLFGGDTEARNQIFQLRQEVQGQIETTSRGQLELAMQNEQMRAELARLRGQNEQLARDVSELQRQQKDVLAVLDERLRVLEPLKVQLDGVEFTATPAEKRDFEAAMAELRKTEFPRAAQMYQQFLRRYPDSGYAPASYYWLGNTHYALREYKEAIAAYQRLITQAPEHSRVPEAMLAIANCQIELKDVRAAKRSLEDLVKAYPKTEAGATARDRLARLR